MPVERFQSGAFPRREHRHASEGSMSEMLVAVVPERTDLQRREALQRANEVRVYRARIKRDLKTGGVSLADVLEDERWATAKVLDVLLAVPKCGRVKAYGVLRRAGISPSKTVGGLTERQWVELWRVLGWFPSVARAAGCRDVLVEHGDSEDAR